MHHTVKSILTLQYFKFFCSYALYLSKEINISKVMPGNYYIIILYIKYILSRKSKSKCCNIS